MEKNVAKEIAENLCESVKKSLLNTKTNSFTTITTTVKNSLKESITKILTPKENLHLLLKALATKKRLSKLLGLFSLTICSLLAFGVILLLSLII